MPARKPTRTLLGVAAGVTATALFGASLAVPAVAGPIDRDKADLAARKLDGKATALPDKWFVQVSGQPSLRGGSRTAAKASQSNVKSAATDAGVKYSVLHSYTRVWNGFSVKATGSDIQKLRHLSGVTAVYPVYTVKLPEKVSEPDLKYSLPMIGVPAARVAGYRGDGIKVGVIDTGIDYNHPDLGGSGVNNQTADFPNSRVKWGYDFVGDDYNADDPSSSPVEDAYPDDCNGHGTHVSGIIGASGNDQPGHATGVAPNVEFGAYRVFGCNGSADTAVILAAMDRAAADDMDVVNMSLGSEFESWPDYPEAQAASALAAAGTIVVSSAGNEGTDGLFTAGNLSLGKDVIAVASVENTNNTNWVATVNPKPGSLADGNIAFAVGEPAPQPSTGAPATLANASVQNGCSPFTGVSGKFALIQRGTCSFYEKALNAQNAGATGVVIYNNQLDGVFAPSVEGEEEITIPVVFIDKTDGDAIHDQLALGTPTSLTWTTGTEASANPYSTTISDFSSFGMGADLKLTPDVAAPGGNIWSTWPVEQKSYANLSGTSMAAPHVTGSVALLLQANAGLKGNVAAVRAALQSTATPISTLNYFGDLIPGYYEPAIRQGAGLIDINKAIIAATSATTVTPGEIALGENRTGYYKTTLKLTNKGTSSETYKLSVQNAANVYPWRSNYWYDYYEAVTGSPTKKVGAKYSSSSVTVKAGRTATVSVYLKQPSGLPLGSIYSGWVKLTKSDKSKTLVVPFAGFQGDYQKVKVLGDVFDYDDPNTPTDVVKVLDLPALSTSEDPADIVAPGAPRPTFSMSGDDVPNLLVHFEYPAQAVYFNVYKATATGTKGAEVFSGYKTWLKLDKWSRDNSWYDITFDGKIPFSQATSSGLTVPDGNYVLEIRVLKALGSASNSAHWESYVTPAFTIDRTVG